MKYIKEKLTNNESKFWHLFFDRYDEDILTTYLYSYHAESTYCFKYFNQIYFGKLFLLGNQNFADMLFSHAV